MWFGPFGDLLRHDKRTPYVTEGYIEVHPEDAKELGCQDGDYVYVDADPPTVRSEAGRVAPEDYKMSRLLVRLRYYRARRAGDAHVAQHVRRDLWLGART